jgi:hypothetical protein
LVPVLKRETVLVPKVVTEKHVFSCN